MPIFGLICLFLSNFGVYKGVSWVDFALTPLHLMRLHQIYFTHLHFGPCEPKNRSKWRNWAILVLIMRDFGRFFGHFWAKYGMFLVVMGNLSIIYIKTL